MKGKIFDAADIVEVISGINQKSGANYKGLSPLVMKKLHPSWFLQENDF